MEVWIGNDASTFNTVHLAGLMFLFRDAIGDQAAVSADSGRGQWESLLDWFWLFEIHDAPLERNSVSLADVYHRNNLVSTIQDTRYWKVGGPRSLSFYVGLGHDTDCFSSRKHEERAGPLLCHRLRCITVRFVKRLFKALCVTGLLIFRGK